MDFEEVFLEKLTWRSYITAEVLPIISMIQLIDKRKFAKVALNENLKTFVIYIIVLEAKLSIYPS